MMTFKNFIIRPLQTNDDNAYYFFVNRNKERLSTYFPKTIKANATISDTQTHIVERCDLANKKEFITFVIIDINYKTIIGSIFIKSIDWSVPKGELGYFIDKYYEQKGIITKSVALIVDYCFNELGFNKTFMRIAKDNIASKHVAEKNGFVVEGILRNDFRTFNDELIDVLYYGLLKNRI